MQLCHNNLVHWEHFYRLWKAINKHYSDFKGGADSTWWTFLVVSAYFAWYVACDDQFSDRPTIAGNGCESSWVLVCVWREKKNKKKSIIINQKKKFQEPTLSLQHLYSRIPELRPP